MPIVATVALIALAAPPLGLGAAPETPRGAPPSLAWQPCRLEHASRLLSLEARCTTLRVPEDEAQPAGRQVDLFVARVPAVSGRKAPDPLLLLAGGPGMGASEMYPGVAPAFARIRRERDLIVVDQRGTGRSGALRCDDDAGFEFVTERGALRTATRRCLEALQARVDLRQYTTSVAVRDLERVREALGIERWNVYGVSYGTRVAQHYLRRFPQRVRSLILDGVVPPDLVLGPDIALDAQAALDRILGRCLRDAACANRFGDPRAYYAMLRDRLRARPVELQLPDPTSGEPQPLRFGPEQLGAVLRLQSYSSATASILPLALHEAATRDHFAPLAGLLALTVRNLAASVASGMHHSVVCTEDLPFVDTAAIDRERLAATYLGTTQLDALQEVCALWPRGVLDAELRAPLRSDVPVLLLSGTDDPVTPPGNAERAMRGLRRARHLVLSGQGHGQIGVTCMDRIVAAFVRDPDPSGLDARCLDAVRPAPFFTTPSGTARVIEARALTRRFGAVQAVAELSFIARDGAITGLLGPNGAGKSTTLRMLYTLLRPDAGHALIDGHDTVADPEGARRRLGVLSHNAGVYPLLSARENILYFGELQGMGRAERERRTEELIDLLEMREFADRRAKGYSQGQRLKTALARALVHSPRNVILDEPTNGLDVMAVRNLRALLLRLRDAGHCVLFSSHVMQEVAGLCDEIVVIAHGRLVAAGTAAALLERAGAATLEDAFVALVEAGSA